jgi:hypothetical protein
MLPVLLRFVKGKDEVAANGHYPWAATAIGLYNFETKEYRKIREEPNPAQPLKPNEILKLFSSIEAFGGRVVFGAHNDTKQFLWFA